MNKPKTYKELLEIVHPLDLQDILDFSGKNDTIKGKGIEHSHWENRRKYGVLIYKSMRKKEDWKNPIIYRNELDKLDNNFYDCIIKCIQDFYWWSHKFNHIHGHIFKRVVHALDIPMNIVQKHFK